MNFLPSVIAYCNTRIDELAKAGSVTDAERELRAVLSLCEGLQRQATLFELLLVPPTQKEEVQCQATPV